MSILNDYISKATRLSDEYKMVVARIDDEQKCALECIRREEAATEASSIIQCVSQSVQQQAHERIEGVVSRCLCAVFEDPYQFKIHFDRKRGRTEARLSFYRNGNEIHPTLGAGIGCVDVAAFALRIACLMLTKPAPRRVLLFDEPFKHLSRNHRPRVAELVETLARELGIQFVIVTHDPEFQIGKVIEI